MNAPLRILHLEDDPKDAELIQVKLEEAGLTCQIVRAENRAEFMTALDETFDLILSDYSIPGFDGLSAVAIAHDKYPDVPVIFVSGTIGEESAVITLQCGATDYVLKGRLSRLVPAIRRALRETEERRERQRAEAALRKSEERFRLVARAANGAIWDWDLVTDTVWWNEGFQKLFGYQPEQIEPDIESWAGRLHPDDRDRVIYGLHMVIDGAEQIWSDEYRFRCANGSYAVVTDRGYVLRESGQPVRMIGSMMEITERKRSEERLKKSEAALAQAQQIARVGNWTWDLSTNNITGSDELYRMFGLSPNECPLTYEAFLERVHPDDHAYVDHLARKSARDGQSFSFECRAVRSDGTVWNLHFRGEVTLDEAGQAIQMVETAQDITERKQAEEERARLAKDLNLLLESTGEGIYGIDTEGKFTFMNKAASRMLGYEPIEALGKNSHALIHHSKGGCSLYPADECPISRMLQTGQSCHVSNEVLWRKDGTSFPVDYASYPLVEDGIIKGAVVTFEDMTIRQRAEEALRESESRLRQILENALDAVIVMDERGIITDWNPRAEAIFGWTRNQIVGRPLDERIIPARYRESHRRGLSRFLETGQGPVLNRRVEITALRRDGHEFPVELSISPLKFGETYYFSAFVADISERKRSEERIREQAALLDVAQDAIVVADMDNRIVFWNKGAESVYGWTAEEALAKKVSELLQKKDDPTFEEAVNALFRDNEWRGELDQITKDGRNIIVLSRWTLVHDADGNPKSVLGVNTDITEKKVLEKKFLQSQRLENLGTLAGGIAHDLNNVRRRFSWPSRCFEPTSMTGRTHDGLMRLKPAPSEGRTWSNKFYRSRGGRRASGRSFSSNTSSLSSKAL